MADGRILLDTTYLLPVFGISVRLRAFEELFPRFLEEYHVLYNPISLVEAKWIVLKLAKREPERTPLLLERFRRGLEALLRDKRLVQTELTNPRIEEVADMLLINAGLADYFDRLIYATAVCEGCVLLTEDRELAQLVRRGDLPVPGGVASWSDIAERLRD